MLPKEALHLALVVDLLVPFMKIDAQAMCLLHILP